MRANEHDLAQCGGAEDEELRESDAFGLSFAPGAELLVEVLLAYFGEAWYGHGRLEGKILPTYAGDGLRTRCIVTAVEPEGDALRVTLSADLVKETGELALAGRASCLIL